MKVSNANAIPSAPSFGQLDRKQSMNDQNSAVVLGVSKLDEDSGKRIWSIGKSDEDYVENGEKKMVSVESSHGLGVWVTALFIIGEMVGAGMVSIPNAMYRQSWYAAFTLVLGGVTSGYSGAQLGWCWTILQERWPELYLKHTRKPYPEIGYRVGGPVVKTLVSICIDLTLFGAACVFLIMASGNISSLLESWFNFRLSFCIWIIIIGACLIPFTLLGSPKDFWQAAIGAAGATLIALIIIMIGIGKDYSKYHPIATYPTPTFVDFVLGYGAILFAYGGHSAFPTIQHDMKKPSKFPISVFWSYAAIFLFYIPLASFAYVAYGAKLAEDTSILLIIPSGWISQTATALITVHVILSYLIVANPVNQEIESIFKIPTNFTWKRAVIRTIYACFIIFASETLPSFGMILDMVGGTTVAAMTFIFPGWFYLALRYCTTLPNSKCDRPIEWWEWPVNIAIIGVGILGGIASMYAAVISVINHGDLFKLPCYVNGGN